MLPAEAYSYLSSRLVKEVWGLGGSVHELVPLVVEQQLEGKKTSDVRIYEANESYFSH